MLTSHPLVLLGSVILITTVITLMANLVMNRWITEKMISQSIEASTAATQESLQPIIEKIQKQTRALDQTYKQSESWEYYLSTLPNDQAQKLRWKIQQQVLEKEQKITNQNVKEGH